MKELKQLRAEYGDKGFVEKIAPYVKYLNTCMESGEHNLNEVYNFTLKEYISSMQGQLKFLKVAKHLIKQQNELGEVDTKRV